MAPVKVFGPLLSPNVTRVILCLEEVGVEYEVFAPNTSNVTYVYRHLYI